MVMVEQAAKAFQLLANAATGRLIEDTDLHSPCEYCGSVAKTSRCVNCGAPRKMPGAYGRRSPVDESTYWES